MREAALERPVVREVHPAQSAPDIVRAPRPVVDAQHLGDPGTHPAGRVEGAAGVLRHVGHQTPA